MTNKPMLSVERELILLLYRAINGGSDQLTGSEHAKAFGELRALLDKPAAHPLEPARWERMSIMRGGQWWPCADKAEADAAVLCGWKVRPLYTEPQAPAAVLPERTAQHQGEPVYQLRNTRLGFVWRDADLEAYVSAAKLLDYERRVMYTEQPAPVAVVMPDDWEDQLFAEMSRRFDLRKQIDDDHMVYDDTQIGVEFACDWIKARLNGVKP